MKEWADLISAIASFLWPVLAFTILVMFRAELRGLFSRVKKGKILGTEWELAEMSAAAKAAVLPSAAVHENIGTVLSSPEFQAELRGDLSEPSDPAQLAHKVAAVIKKTAEAAIKGSFISIDTTPLLGPLGRRVEAPYRTSTTVEEFLDSIWSIMYPHVRAYTYGDGWLLRNVRTGELLTELKSSTNENAGERTPGSVSIGDAGIAPGAEYEVVRGPHPRNALRLIPS